MNNLTRFPALIAGTMRHLLFAPVAFPDGSSYKWLSEGHPVAVRTMGGFTFLYAWVDAPLDGPADYFYIAEPKDYALHGPHAVYAEQAAK